MNRRGCGGVSLADRWALIHEEEYRKKMQFGQILATTELNHSRDLVRATEHHSGVTHKYTILIFTMQTTSSVLFLVEH